MALLFQGKTECPLCHDVIQLGEDVVATSHFIADQTDSLWRFSDASFHKACFLMWDRRGDFVSRFNAVMTERFGERRFMNDDGSYAPGKPDP
jgi:hypothetical protein